MATQNAVHTSINMLIHAMRERGASRARHHIAGNYSLTWHHSTSGYSLVWEDRTTGGVSVIARLGKTKPQVIETCRATMEILQTIERTD